MAGAVGCLSPVFPICVRHYFNYLKKKWNEMRVVIRKYIFVICYSLKENIIYSCWLHIKMHFKSGCRRITERRISGRTLQTKLMFTSWRLVWHIDSLPYAFMSLLFLLYLFFIVFFFVFFYGNPFYHFYLMVYIYGVSSAPTIIHNV